MKFPFHRQLNKKDCGATCLQMVADYYGRKYSLKHLREISYISREGSSLMGISDAAERIGFRTLGLCVNLESLKTCITLPCILHWNQNHYVVCYKIAKRANGKTRYYVADPATMKRVYDEADFQKHWISTNRNKENRGVLLSLEVKPEFYEFEDNRSLGRSHGIERYLKYLKPHKGALAQNIMCVAIIMALGMVIPFLTQLLVDIGVRGGNLDFVLLILLSQLVLAITNMLVGMINSWVTIHTSTRINLSLLSDFWEKLLKLPARFYDTTVAGDIAQRFGDYGRIEDFLLHSSVDIIFASVNFIVYSTILFLYNGVVLCVFFVGYTIYVLWVLCFLKTWKRMDFEKFELSARNNNKSLQLIQGVIDIKLNNEERQKRWEWEKIQAGMFRLSLKSLKYGSLQGNIGSLIMNVTNIVISYLVAKEVIYGNMTIGMMMAITYITGQIAAPVNQFVNFIHSLQYTKIALERLNEVHDMDDEDTDLDNKISDLPASFDICFDHVCFSYDGSPRRYVLKNVSFNIPAHKTTAIVGHSGCGKTTIMKLLLGLYKATAGDVMVGKIPLSQINPHVWRRGVGSVMQDGYLFSDSIANNIATNALEIDKTRLYDSAKMAQVEQFVHEQPHGYNTKIGMEGTGVSQGQKQRILIARAIYKNPEVLLFDEATNSLDSSNEHVIMDNITEFCKNRTVVIAAHRLSTIKNADQIIVMEKGKVVEIGTHDELVSLGGVYSELVHNQI